VPDSRHISARKLANADAQFSVLRDEHSVWISSAQSSGAGVFHEMKNIFWRSLWILSIPIVLAFIFGLASLQDGSAEYLAGREYDA